MVVKVTGPLSLWWIFFSGRIACLPQANHWIRCFQKKHMPGYAFPKKAYPWIRFFKKVYPWIRFFKKKHIPGCTFSKKAYPWCFWRLFGIPEKNIPRYTFSMPPQEHIHSRKEKLSFSLFSEHIQVYLYMVPYLSDDPNWFRNWFF